MADTLVTIHSIWRWLVWSASSWRWPMGSLDRPTRLPGKEHRPTVHLRSDLARYPSVDRPPGLDRRHRLGSRGVPSMDSSGRDADRSGCRACAGRSSHQIGQAHRLPVCGVGHSGYLGDCGRHIPRGRMVLRRTALTLMAVLVLTACDTHGPWTDPSGNLASGGIIVEYDGFNPLWNPRCRVHRVCRTDLRQRSR